ncbi:hypothetical protein SAMN02910413_0303 [Pseudobutyrivibrio sp. C4]|uniref:hypothetical protein n=1 Tax=Pseudobutyrivibrio sp. C4 TaxID=1520803 RepID=UPI0008CB3D14|nr:hypothetical protein [Pseudobutyrivibrio sp. C4]SES65372.1 hypothetical protein SAMN02910413_0303 [Pseudobutyrivibrio sp. C4]
MDRIVCSREDLFAAGNHFALMQMVAMDCMEESILDDLICVMMDKLYDCLTENQQELVDIMIDEQERRMNAGIVDDIKRNGFDFKFEA